MQFVNVGWKLRSSNTHTTPWRAKHTTISTANDFFFFSSSSSLFYFCFPLHEIYLCLSTCIYFLFVAKRSPVWIGLTTKKKKKVEKLIRTKQREKKTHAHTRSPICSFNFSRFKKGCKCDGQYVVFFFSLKVAHQESGLPSPRNVHSWGCR